MQIDQQAVISVKEARKILGKTYSYKSDADLLKLIKQFDSVAAAFIKMVPKY